MNLKRDLQYCLRGLSRNPAFSVIAVLTLALGMGANTGIFGVLYSVVLRPLPYRDPGSLVKISTTYTDQPELRFAISSPDFESIRSGAARSFEAFALSKFWSPTLLGVDAPAGLRAARVTGDFFAVFGVPAQEGRILSAADDTPGGARVAVLSFSFWRRKFGSDPGAVGRQIRLDGGAYTIAGVMPAGFEVAERSDLWVPLAGSGAPVGGRGQRDGNVYARLRPATNRATAQSELKVVGAATAREFPITNGHTEFVVRRLQDVIVGKSRPALLVLFAAVCFVLLMACANVAQLLLARNAFRQTEVAIRISLGAGRADILRIFLVESMVLTLAGAAVALPLASWAIRLGQVLAPVDMPRLESAGITPAVLAFALLLSIVAAVLLGIFPALQTLRSDPNAVLKSAAGGLRAASLPRKARAETMLVVQVCLSLVLLVGAGVMARSLYRLLSVNPGFASAGVLTMELCLPQSSYSAENQQAAFFRKLEVEAAATPGVRAFGLSTTLPLSGSSSEATVLIEGQPALGEQQIAVQSVSPRLAGVLQIPMESGRPLSVHDGAAQPHVAVINLAMARRFWPHGDAVGKRFHGAWSGPGEWTEVVGIMANTRNLDLRAEPTATAWLPYEQAPSSCMYAAAAGEGDPMGLARPLTESVSRVDRNQPVAQVRTMERVLTQSIAEPRFVAVLLAVFAALALTLAAVGIYGGVSSSVAQSTREIGIRFALGASRADVLGMFLRRTLRVVGSGILFGAAAALIAMRVMSSFVYEVRPEDPLSFAAAAVLLGLIAVVATLVPAQAAARQDPLRAIRYE